MLSIPVDLEELFLLSLSCISERQNRFESRVAQCRDVRFAEGFWMKVISKKSAKISEVSCGLVARWPVEFVTDTTDCLTFLLQFT